VGYLLLHDHATWAHGENAHGWLLNNHLDCLDDFPPVSPDLNAIEYVWSWMNKYIQRRHPDSQQRLEDLVEEAWNEIPQQIIVNYIDHMIGVCDQIIENRGGHSGG